MTAAIIFVLVILILGGVIAIISDRLGKKVGKARLSIFNLRPRKTAVVVTMIAGTFLSALTLTALFATSKPLRRGVFQIDEIQAELNEARKELTKTELEKGIIEGQLARTLGELNQINQSLQTTRILLGETQAQLTLILNQLETIKNAKTQVEIELKQVEDAKAKTQAELNQTQEQLKVISEQKQALEREIEELQTERQKLIDE
ncbi:MAG: DUF3084 domain-containing protein [Okeania sp. SIO2H7]|nr:DUF3084 domain-containing protein [Okeania sp. SIO2H7]